MYLNNTSFRETMRNEDVRAIRTLVSGSTELFSAFEADIAEELAVESILKGADNSGYHFILAEDGERLLGYTCYGPIGCTVNRFDLYWIVVDAGIRGKGVGTKLMKKTEDKIIALGGERLYIETSFRVVYEPTRRFYQKCGYRVAAILQDFYAQGDDKVIFCKDLLKPHLD